MRVMIIGNAGSGKSSLARKLTAALGWPLLGKLRPDQRVVVLRNQCNQQALLRQLTAKR
ncbi:AAA family ATPase [Lacticaseibacillus songhuajiangensis]|jgi:MoxR-like ATPase|uniref:AAA family ATPase n=1 Tax=Lacticaseibacillus songhuajiangensis TaxID=1296539 RepID=UPI000F7A8C97|nr:AAA family ATPase [Lacticaseibacillus songhuajiangensis]